jgi:hypothetical protein
VAISQDEDGAFISECPSIPGCASQGKTEVAAALRRHLAIPQERDRRYDARLHRYCRNIEQAIKERLEVRAERGMPLTFLTREVEVPI